MSDPITRDDVIRFGENCKTTAKRYSIEISQSDHPFSAMGFTIASVMLFAVADAIDDTFTDTQQRNRKEETDKP